MSEDGQAGQALEVTIGAVVRRADGTIKSAEWARYARDENGDLVLVDQEVYENGSDSGRGIDQ